MSTWLIKRKRKENTDKVIHLLSKNDLTALEMSQSLGLFCPDVVMILLDLEKGAFAERGEVNNQGFVMWKKKDTNNAVKPKAATTSKPTVVPKPKEKLKTIEINLDHCGQFAISEDTIEGWFQPISMKQWEEIVGFHRSVSLEHDAETVSYHRWNPKTKEYDTIIPWQVTQGSGLSVKTDWSSDANSKLLDDYAKENGCDFFPANTIHTHVAASAFESGTDAADEEDLPGWHITLGHISTKDKVMDTDTRFRLPKFKPVKERTSVMTSYDIELKHLFEEGTDLKKVTQCRTQNPKFNEFKSRVNIIRSSNYRGSPGQKKG